MQLGCSSRPLGTDPFNPSRSHSFIDWFTMCRFIACSPSVFCCLLLLWVVRNRTAALLFPLPGHLAVYLSRYRCSMTATDQVDGCILKGFELILNVIQQKWRTESCHGRLCSWNRLEIDLERGWSGREGKGVYNWITRRTTVMSIWNESGRDYSFTDWNTNFLSLSPFQLKSASSTQSSMAFWLPWWPSVCGCSTRR